jgi:hypothetical protein
LGRFRISFLTDNLLEEIDRIGSDVRWLERLKKRLHSRAPKLYPSEAQARNAIDRAIKTLPKKHDAKTVALWTKRLEAFKAEVQREFEVAKAKEEAARAKEDERLLANPPEWFSQRDIRNTKKRVAARRAKKP